MTLKKVRQQIEPSKVFYNTTKNNNDLTMLNLLFLYLTLE